MTEIDTQYDADVKRLSELIGKYTGIPESKTESFIRECGATKLIAEANALCDTESQRAKLSALFEFKRLYETVKSGGERERRSINDTERAKSYFIEYFADKSDREYFAVAYFNRQYGLIKTATMSAGTVNQSMVYPREIIKEALFRNASAIMLAHNHPGGGMSASPEDHKVTAAIVAAAKTVNIEVVDHIIVVGDEAVSFREEGLLHAASPVEFERALAASVVGEPKTEASATKNANKETTVTEDANQTEGEATMKNREIIPAAAKAEGERPNGEPERRSVEFMTKKTKDDLKAVLEAHKKWLNGEPGGTQANLADAYLRGADLRFADLRGAILKNADLSNAKMFHADLTDADLSGADFYCADMERANLTGANVAGADFYCANPSRAIAEGANINRAYLRGATFGRTGGITEKFAAAKAEAERLNGERSGESETKKKSAPER